MLGIMAGMDQKDCYVAGLCCNCGFSAVAAHLQGHHGPDCSFNHKISQLFVDKVVDAPVVVVMVINIPVVAQMPFPVVLETIELPQLLVDKVVDVVDGWTPRSQGVVDFYTHCICDKVCSSRRWLYLVCH